MLKELKLIQLLQKSSWSFLENLEIKIPFEIAMSLLDMFSNQFKILHYNDTCIPVFIGIQLMTAKSWKQFNITIIEAMGTESTKYSISTMENH